MCSRNQCRTQIYGATGKAKEIAELKARLAEKDALIASQADLIAALKLKLQQRAPPQQPSRPALQEPLQPPPPSPEHVEARRPALQPIDANAVPMQMLPRHRQRSERRIPLQSHVRRQRQLQTPRSRQLQTPRSRYLSHQRFHDSCHPPQCRGSRVGFEATTQPPVSSGGGERAPGSGCTSTIRAPRSDVARWPLLALPP